MPELLPQPLLTADQIARRITEMAADIARDLSPSPMVVSLLRGSFVFTADLLRALHTARPTLRPTLDFMTLSSYGRGTQSSGAVQVVRDLAETVEQREVLLVDDILESGHTLSFAVELLKRKGATRVLIAVLLEKPGKRHIPLEADYVGFTIPDRFVVGYGLDHAGYYRELPFIGCLA